MIKSRRFYGKVLHSVDCLPVELTDEDRHALEVLQEAEKEDRALRAVDHYKFNIKL